VLGRTKTRNRDVTKRVSRSLPERRGKGCRLCRRGDPSGRGREGWRRPVAGVGLKKRADHYPPVLHWSRFLMRPVRDAPAITEIPPLESGRIKTSHSPFPPCINYYADSYTRRGWPTKEYTENTRFLRLERPSDRTASIRPSRSIGASRMSLRRRIDRIPGILVLRRLIDR